MREPRDDFGLVVIGEKLWAVGGMTGSRGNVLNSVEVYDPRTDRWSPAPVDADGPQLSRVAGLGNVIYVAGGLAEGGQISDVVEALDTRTGTWSRRASLPTPRMELTAVAVNGTVWALGGSTGRAPTGVVEVYNPADDRWSSAEPLPTPRYSLAASVANGRVYAVGGQTPERAVTVVEVADPVRSRWESAPPLPEGLTVSGSRPSDRICTRWRVRATSASARERRPGSRHHPRQRHGTVCRSLRSVETCTRSAAAPRTGSIWR